MTKSHVFAMLAIACVAVLAGCTQSKETVVALEVKTQYGVLQGFEEDGVKKFLGVPFAQPPVGELRWKAPQPVQNWEGVRTAKQFGDEYGNSCSLFLHSQTTSTNPLYTDIVTCSRLLHAKDYSNILQQTIR